MFAIPKLPFEFEEIAYIRVDINETYTLVRRVSDNTYISYVMNDEGVCFSGHYDMPSLRGLHDVMERATRSPRLRTRH